VANTFALRRLFLVNSVIVWRSYVRRPSDEICTLRYMHDEGWRLELISKPFLSTARAYIDLAGRVHKTMIDI
jgi:hypothetical protein